MMIHFHDVHICFRDPSWYLVFSVVKLKIFSDIESTIKNKKTNGDDNFLRKVIYFHSSSYNDL